MLFLAAIEDEQDRSKVEALYARYSKDMFKVAYRVLKDYQSAQDAVQAAFINIINNLEKISEIDCNRTRAFVVIIVRNISINLYRKGKKICNMELEALDEILPDDGKAVEEIVIDSEMLNLIASKIKELYPPYSDIISLKYFYQYTNEEIAALLNITEENVRTRLHRARQSFFKLLSQDGELCEDERLFRAKSKS